MAINLQYLKLWMNMEQPIENTAEHGKPSASNPVPPASPLAGVLADITSVEASTQSAMDPALPILESILNRADCNDAKKIKAAKLACHAIQMYHRAAQLARKKALKAVKRVTPIYKQEYKDFIEDYLKNPTQYDIDPSQLVTLFAEDSANYDTFLKKFKLIQKIVHHKKRKLDPGWNPVQKKQKLNLSQPTIDTSQKKLNLLPPYSGLNSDVTAAKANISSAMDLTCRFSESAVNPTQAPNSAMNPSLPAFGSAMDSATPTIASVSTVDSAPPARPLAGVSADATSVVSSTQSAVDPSQPALESVLNRADCNDAKKIKATKLACYAIQLYQRAAQRAQEAARNGVQRVTQVYEQEYKDFFEDYEKNPDQYDVDPCQLSILSVRDSATYDWFIKKFTVLQEIVHHKKRKLDPGWNSVEKKQKLNLAQPTIDTSQKKLKLLPLHPGLNSDLAAARANISSAMDPTCPFSESAVNPVQAPNFAMNPALPVFGSAMDSALPTSASTSTVDSALPVIAPLSEEDSTLLAIVPTLAVDSA